MQTGTKKTPDRFQNYFCPAAANDIVHHAYAWIVKEPNMQPKFLYCRAIDDPANDRGWNIIAEVWERDVLGGWGISSSTMHPEFEDTADGYVLAENMPGTVASLPYQVFREVVNEHDMNYLIALAIATILFPILDNCDILMCILAEQAGNRKYQTSTLQKPLSRKLRIWNLGENARLRCSVIFVAHNFLVMEISEQRNS